jgi:hypothetical protein
LSSRTQDHPGFEKGVTMNRPLRLALAIPAMIVAVWVLFKLGDDSGDRELACTLAKKN